MLCKKIDIWENRKYKGVESDGRMPYMDTYILEGTKIRPTVLIFPGGGYSYCSPREAEPIALQFTSKGYNAFVLYYSVAPNKHPLPLLDAALAMAIIRENSFEWNVDDSRIFVCGFSAGGHLAASLGTLWNKDYVQNELGMESEMYRPDGLVLCYPVISYGEFMHKGSFDNLVGENLPEEEYEKMSLEKQVGSHVPKTFLWHTFEDGAVPLENTMLFAQALRKHDVPFELHVYPNGGHGLALANEETAVEGVGIIDHVAGWINLCAEWMETVE